jgi:hypothetical protein
VLTGRLDDQDAQRRERRMQAPRTLDLATLAQDETAVEEIGVQLGTPAEDAKARLWTEELTASGEKNG